MNLTIAARGAVKIDQALVARHRRLASRYRMATRAAAVRFQRSLRDVLPRRTGNLRRHVRIFGIGEYSWKVKVTGQVAHLVIDGTSSHEIVPRGAEAAQRGRRRVGRAIVAGPMQARRALAFPGASHPFPRAIIPAHHGDQTLVPRARAEGSQAARAAAFEVLKT